MGGIAFCTGETNPVAPFWQNSFAAGVPKNSGAMIKYKLSPTLFDLFLQFQEGDSLNEYLVRCFVE
jgi:hypothetical protein